MSAEEHKAVARRFYEQVLNQRNLDVLAEVIAPEGVDHSAAPGTLPGREWVRQTVQAFLAAFPDFRYRIEDLIAEGDKVVVRATWSGTHQGDLMGIPATGRAVTVSVIEMARLANGQMVEHWAVSDNLSLMQQLGAIPALGQAG